MRLARHATPLTTGGMVRFLKACGISVAAYKLWTGFHTLSEDITANPDWGLRRWQELVLENIDTLRQNGSKGHFKPSTERENGVQRVP